MLRHAKEGAIGLDARLLFLKSQQYLIQHCMKFIIGMYTPEAVPMFGKKRRLTNSNRLKGRAFIACSNETVLSRFLRKQESCQSLVWPIQEPLVKCCAS